MFLNKSPYAIHRVDRQNGERGGGVAIITHYRIKSRCIRVTLPNIFSYLEIICIDVIDNNFKNRLIVVYCLPPAAILDYLASFYECLAVLCNVDYACIICGNFNMPGLDWLAMDGGLACRESYLADFVINNGLSQLVLEPTREKIILDLVLSNDPLAVIDLTVSLPFSTSDHSSLSWSLLSPEPNGSTNK